MAEDIPKDMLFLACTRPAMRGGVPVEGLFINSVISYLLFLWVARANIASISGIVILVMCPVNHYLMRILVSIDHNIFRIGRLWLETKGIQFRGVSVLWAFPPKYTKAKDMTSCLNS